MHIQSGLYLFFWRRCGSIQTCWRNSTFYIEPGTDKAVEIRFSPTSVGLKSSEIIIKIGEDTLINNIRGEGIQNQLSLNTSFINFGKIRVGNYKDTTIKSIISNNGSVPVKISKIYPTTPNDKDFKVISGDSPFTLNPGGTHEIVLRFTPSESGRTTGRIAMEYDNTGSPIYVLLFG